METSSSIKKRPIDCTVRFAQKSDLNDILRVEQTGYPFPWSQGVFQDCFKPNYYFLVLESSAIGLMGYSVVSNIVGEAHLLNICIDDKFREQGFGQYLLEQTIAHCISDACELMLLEVRVSNGSAIHLYQKLGFTELGIRKNYYPGEGGREDALVLQLPLIQTKIDERV
ncbi:ribosomal protein S18-alanine N-acetyltransferase [Litoribacillus peritrichatus]|uniref:[Ribosomal protein bS18]-alanine N-acetyltransferase n=1 Tax=Litoribacillus peritrichatus TaxID=718191 RepID=A0ABP7LVN8_9GAMM